MKCAQMCPFWGFSQLVIKWACVHFTGISWKTLKSLLRCCYFPKNAMHENRPCQANCKIPKSHEVLVGWLVQKAEELSSYLSFPLQWDWFTHFGKLWLFCHTRARDWEYMIHYPHSWKAPIPSHPHPHPHPRSPKNDAHSTRPYHLLLLLGVTECLQLFCPFTRLNHCMQSLDAKPRKQSEAWSG